MEQNSGLPNNRRIPPYRLNLRGIWNAEEDVDNAYRGGFQDFAEEFPYLPMSREEDFNVVVAKPSTSLSNRAGLTRDQIVASDSWLGKKGMAPIKTTEPTTTATTETHIKPKQSVPKQEPESPKLVTSSSSSSSTIAAGPSSPVKEICNSVCKADQEVQEASEPELQGEAELRSEISVPSAFGFDDEGRVYFTDNGSCEKSNIAIDRATSCNILGYQSSHEIFKGIPDDFVQHGEVPKNPKACVNNYCRCNSYMSRILNVKGPENFYISLQHNQSAKDALYNELGSHYTKTLLKGDSYGLPNPNFLIPGQVVVCIIDKYWYRAQILCILAVHEDPEDLTEKLYKVFLLDEGAEVQVLMPQIRYMCRKFLNYRVCAIKCALDKKNPCSPWAFAAMKRFLDLVQDGARVNLKYIRKDVNDPRTWIVRLKLNIDGGSKYDKRYVDIGQEIRSYVRRTNIVSMYQPMKSWTDDDEPDEKLMVQPRICIRPLNKTTFNFRLPFSSNFKK